jgi:hypothetical protein
MVVIAQHVAVVGGKKSQCIGQLVGIELEDVIDKERERITTLGVYNLT